jgi:hypothetical protein
VLRHYSCEGWSRAGELLLPLNDAHLPHVLHYRPPHLALSDPRFLEFDYSAPQLAFQNSQIKSQLAEAGMMQGCGADGLMSEDERLAKAWTRHMQQIARAERRPGPRAGQEAEAAEPPARGAGAGAWAREREGRGAAVPETAAARDNADHHFWRVDLDAPLLQLFFQTLAPWFRP